MHFTCRELLGVGYVEILILHHSVCVCAIFSFGVQMSTSESVNRTVFNKGLYTSSTYNVFK